MKEPSIIYLDNAATSCPKPPAVVNAVANALQSFGNVGRGAHEEAVSAGMAVFEARQALSDLLKGPGADRVSFAANATMALNIAIDGLLAPGAKAITTAASHNSVLRPLFRARDERGCTVAVAPINPDGSLDWEAYLALLPGANVVALTHASNLTGDVYDIAAMARAAHGHGALVIVDAAQTAGCIPVSMAELGADVLCFTGHKSLLGPQGTGGLIVARHVDIPPLLEGGSGHHSFDERHPRIMPESLEAGTVNAHGIAGLGAGVAYLAERGVEAVAAHERSLVLQAREGLGAIPGIALLGGRGTTPGIVAFNVGDVDSGLVADVLAQDFGICTRAGAHCAPLMHKALGTEHQGAVRASFGPFNTEQDVVALLEAVGTIARQAEEGTL